MKKSGIIRRAAAAALAIALMLSALGAQAAEKRNIMLMGETNNYFTATQEELSQSQYIQSIASLGDTLYLLGDRALFYWRPDMDKAQSTNLVFRSSDPETMESRTDVSLNRIAAADGKLYGINADSYEVYRIDGEPSSLTITSMCTLSGLSDVSRSGEVYIDTSIITISGDTLYLVANDYTSASVGYSMYMFDLNTGERRVSKVNDVHTISLYKEGQLLLKAYDDESMWDENTGNYRTPTVSVYDIASDSIIQTVEATGITQPYSFGGFQYDAASDTLYFLNGSDVMSVKDLTFPGKRSAYLPTAGYESMPTALLESGMYAMCSYSSSGVTVRGLDMPGLDSGALTIYGDYGSNAHNTFVNNHPEINVTTSNEYMDDMEKLASSMIAGEGMDVLRLEANYSPVERLIDKGYALDLSGYPEIVECVNKMYPALTRLVMRNGRIYGVPVSMNSWGLSIDDNILEQIGLSADDIPTNLMDLMDFVAYWEDDYGDDFPDIRCMDDTDLRNSFLQNIMSYYVSYCIQQGQELSFNTDLFRSLLNKLESVTFPDTGWSEDMSISDWDEYYSKGSLMYWGGSSVTDLTNYRYQRPVTISLTKDTDPIISTDIALFIVNSKTQRPDQAVMYLREYVENMGDDPNFEYASSPDKNEPFVNPRYESDLAEWKKSVATMEKQLETCEPSEKQDLQRTIEYYKEMIDNTDMKYFISPEAITYYRENIAPYLVVPGKTPLSWESSGNNDLHTQIELYRQKAISTDQFIKEIDKRVRMMRLEDQ